MAATLASKTAPVCEVIQQDETGRLVDFFDGEALVDQVCELLDDEAARIRLGKAAREMMIEGYELNRICLPRQMEWLQSVMDAPKA